MIIDILPFAFYVSYISIHLLNNLSVQRNKDITVRIPQISKYCFECFSKDNIRYFYKI